MHPNLAPHLHPSCQEIVKQLKDCHSNNPLGKFFGVCNEARLELDACLTKEALVRRDINYHNAMEEKARVRAKLKEKGLVSD
mmetsp:Transcript_11436/g.20695  ORF Transcript_11436/g.20695 Transcript_11436/m.20695 type:complete len:82 (+) Transcript_11436:57-302(+)